MQKLRDFINQQIDIVDRLNRVVYSSSLLDKIAEAHTRTGDRKQAIRDRVSPFFESVPKFGDWVKLSDVESWKKEIEKLYEKQL